MKEEMSELKLSWKVQGRGSLPLPHPLSLHTTSRTFLFSHTHHPPTSPDLGQLDAKGSWSR